MSESSEIDSDDLESQQINLDDLYYTDRQEETHLNLYLNHDHENVRTYDNFDVLQQDIKDKIRSGK